MYSSLKRTFLDKNLFGIPSIASASLPSAFNKLYFYRETSGIRLSSVRFFLEKNRCSLWHKSKSRFSIRQKQIDTRCVSMLNPTTALNGHENLGTFSRGCGMFIQTPRWLYSSPFDFWILQLRWARRAETSARNLLTARLVQVSSHFTHCQSYVCTNFTAAKRFTFLTSFSLDFLS